MLENLAPQPADALLALIKLHNADPRADKIDLGVGVYRTSDGATPVFAAIKAAEKRLLDTQDSKAYLGPEGDMGFVHALIPYVFGADFDRARVEGMQAPGGTGAVRLAVEVAKRAGIKRLWMGTPSWPNHAQIVNAIGLELKTFPHMTADGAADLDALKAALAHAEPGDAVLLHGCCHNPTGVDYTDAQWDEIAPLLQAQGVLPILDLAYQGLGAGMEADAYGLRKVLATVPEALVAYSCDKNFGLYRDRVGAFYAVTSDADALAKAMSNGATIARASWSMPPDHGAAAVRLVLEDAELTKLWLAELDEMRDRMRWVRDRLAAAQQVGTVNMAPLGTQHGLFSMLPLNGEQILAIREKHGVYMAGSGRINIAGLTNGNIEKFIEALGDVAA
ncbi:aspartate/tyrosine/aromatic aminotransferase [Novosphingobium sp. NBM11]|uniref:amino acid aminotransferase n=1 Tax=unclassified Novosphingobium TaxID=2644732 RepID=UPI00061B9B24|nr:MULTISPECIES: amino acid aminotransferase [unclassified Novosphingobium]MBF5089468.1 aspartate/tyrosine/aromatic aminotransferase [Novosphingobium sp. NBM11]GAO56777.1 aspartate aminotransferase [Novosphingobium sp. MD-1]